MQVIKNADMYQAAKRQIAQLTHATSRLGQGYVSPVS